MGGSVLKLAIGIVAFVLGLLIALSAVFLVAVGSLLTKNFVWGVAIVGLIIAGTGGWTTWNALE
jgi:hypothetical protein